MNFKDANKTLTRALFVAGADSFEKRFMASPQALRDLFQEALRIAFPKGAFEPDAKEPGVVVGSFPDAEVSEIRISVYNLLNSLDRADLQRSRDMVVSHLIRASDAITDAMTADPHAHLKGPLIIVMAEDRKLVDYAAATGGNFSFVSWAVSENLNAAVAVETRAGAAYLRLEDLPKLGLSEKQAGEKAKKAMEERLRKNPPTFEALADGVTLVSGAGPSIQSALALDGFAQGLRHRLGGDVIVLAAENLLVVAEVSKPRAVGFLLSVDAHRKVENLFPGSYFLADAEGFCTLGWEDLAHVVELGMATRADDADDAEERSGPTFN